MKNQKTSDDLFLSKELPLKDRSELDVAKSMGPGILRFWILYEVRNEMIETWSVAFQKSWDFVITPEYWICANFTALLK